MNFGGAFFGAFAGVGAIVAWMMRPTIHGTNSTKNILKEKDLDGFFLKELEYSRIISRTRELVRHPEDATFGAIALLLDDLGRSPFYDDSRHKSAYKNLRIMEATRQEKMKKADLHSSGWWLWKKEPCSLAGDYCTKDALLRELYVSMYPVDVHSFSRSV